MFFGAFHRTIAICRKHHKTSLAITNMAVNILFLYLICFDLCIILRHVEQRTVDQDTKHFIFTYFPSHWVFREDCLELFFFRKYASSMIFDQMIIAHILYKQTQNSKRPSQYHHQRPTPTTTNQQANPSTTASSRLPPRRSIPILNIRRKALRRPIRRTIIAACKYITNSTGGRGSFAICWLVGTLDIAQSLNVRVSSGEERD